MGCIWESAGGELGVGEMETGNRVDWLDWSVWWIHPPDGLKTIGRWFGHSVRSDGAVFISLLCACLSHLSSLHSFSSLSPNQGGAYFSLSFRLWLGNQSDYSLLKALSHCWAEEEACPRSYSCILQNLFFPAVMREWGVLHLCNIQTILKLGVYTKNVFFSISKKK